MLIQRIVLLTLSVLALAFAPVAYGRAVYQDEIGSAHVTVLSVMDWNTYRQSLQPTFEMSEQNALSQAMRVSFLDDQMLRDVLTAGVELASPGASSGNKSPETNSTPSEARSGSQGQGGQGAAAQDEKSKSLTTEFSLGNQQLAGVNPLLAYDAATALFENVKLRNVDLVNAAIPPGYTAYIVRLNVNLQPYKRDAPYDAYIDSAFFYGKPLAAPENSKGTLLWREEGIITAAMTNGSPIMAQSAVQIDDSSEKQIVPNVRMPEPQAYQEIYEEMPRVLPLLCTDDFETALQTNATDRTRAYSFSLLSLISGLGGSGLGRQLQRIESMTGYDLNNLQTVARLTDNSIRIRIGAMRKVDKSYSLPPKSNTVTLLVMIPTKQLTAPGKEISVYTKALFTNVATGKTLPSRPVSHVDDAITSILVREQLPVTDNNKAMLNLLAQLAQINNWAAFIQILHIWQGQLGLPEGALTGQAMRYWTEFVSLRVGSDYDYTWFEAPAHEDQPVAPSIPEQSVLLFDDDATSTVNLYGVTGLEAKDISAVLHIDADKPQQSISFVAASITKSTGNTLTISFPSLAQWNIINSQNAAQHHMTLTVEQTLKQGPTTAAGWSKTFEHVIYREKSSKEEENRKP